MLDVRSPVTLRHRRAMLFVIAARWNKLLDSLRAPYRPELHYMRGPGPRWRARHQNHAQHPAA